MRHALLTFYHALLAESVLCSPPGRCAAAAAAAAAVVLCVCCAVLCVCTEMCSKLCALNPILLLLLLWYVPISKDVAGWSG